MDCIFSLIDFENAKGNNLDFQFKKVQFSYQE